MLSIGCCCLLADNQEAPYRHRGRLSFMWLRLWRWRILYLCRLRPGRTDRPGSDNIFPEHDLANVAWWWVRVSGDGDVGVMTTSKHNHASTGGTHKLHTECSFSQNPGPITRCGHTTWWSTCLTVSVHTPMRPCCTSVLAAKILGTV